MFIEQNKHIYAGMHVYEIRSVVLHIMSELRLNWVWKVDLDV